MQDQLVVKLKNAPFSLNLDEATLTNLLRVFSVVVSSYDKEKHSLVVEQLASLSISVVDAENLFRELQSVFLQFNLPWENLMVMMLRDSASVMGGEKNGLEKRVRDLAPHLIDIDGDSCHHMHNIVKNFTNHFDKFLEGLFRNIYTDFKTSADSLEMLKEISFHLGLTFRKPVNYIAARWLSVLDTSLEFTYMRNAYRIYYHSIIKADIRQELKKVNTSLKKGYMDSLDKTKQKLERKMRNFDQTENSIFSKHNVSDASKEEITRIQGSVEKKYQGGTDAGKQRKTRIVTKPVLNDRHVSLLTSIYDSVLPLFKSYVMLFQQEQPLIHKIYYEQIDVVRTFLSYFVKPEVLAKCKNAKQLRAIDLSGDNILPTNLIFIGQKAKSIVKEKDKEFLEKVVNALITTHFYPCSEERSRCVFTRNSQIDG